MSGFGLKTQDFGVVNIYKLYNKKKQCDWLMGLHQKRKCKVLYNFFVQQNYKLATPIVSIV